MGTCITVAVSIDLKACLVPDPVERARPLNFHERTGHILPPDNNLLQFYIHDTENFARENKLVINKKKTKVISFTKSRNWDFPPEFNFSDGSQIEYISDTKLVGLVVSQDLRWDKNTDYICSKARQKLWILRRLLKLDLVFNKMFDFYIKEICSILELASCMAFWADATTIRWHWKNTEHNEGESLITLKKILQAYNISHFFTHNNRITVW